MASSGGQGSGVESRSSFTCAAIAARSTTAAPVPGSVVERIAPEAFLRAMIHDADKRPINASSKRRHSTTRQKRVVRERDRTCVDCGAAALLEFDHVPEYATSGRTVVGELQLRCAPCQSGMANSLFRWLVNPIDSHSGGELAQVFKQGIDEHDGSDHLQKLLHR